MKKKCFVSGGAGLIGLEICKELLRYGCEVHLYDLGEKIQKNRFNIPKDIIIHEGSILDLFALEKAMTSCKYIFHLAAMLGVKYTEDNKLAHGEGVLRPLSLSDDPVCLIKPSVFGRGRCR